MRRRLHARTRVAALATLVILAAFAAAPSLAVPAARAQFRPGAPEPYHSTFWTTVRAPGRARARALMIQGLYWLRKSGAGPYETNAYVQNAIVRFERARALAPDDLDVMFLLARAYQRWELPDPGHDVTRRDDEAIALFSEIRRRDPEYESEAVAFELGVLHTRTHDFVSAAAEYERAIELSFEPDAGNVGVVLSNLAEVTMLAGDVQRAVRFYERAVAISNRTGATPHLPLFGLAVALDRLGEHRQAIETATQAVIAGGNTLETLHLPDVFFEPAYELYWYEGLGHIALASTTTDATARDRELEQAEEAFARYLRDGGAETPWAAIARDHVAELARQRGARGGRMRTPVRASAQGAAAQ